ncbi:SasC/FmtB family protein [Staphylococcus simiae]|uniref:DUF1542 domain-containing protein n=1 Tax=Staphylococcus simiae CCM 7213 = CCUG 51256 TaxID=911238 RepID=G5JFF8_9STAP|nr:SasC/FmtB family protein [Staphylococcus simiae]EHJ09075.1 hypothetical protein SS7213T_00828 [Staphylococcus simiae CCM 7213 = CCUG 51256]PNZ11214.1 DUF1542 domain-containing protein [Staphylococcus simiae]SNV77765.1 putative surface anchored protein [Staphylococcus simiae]
MNLFREQKFSIRKFNVGIFSTLIATVTFITANTSHASAAEQPSNANQLDNTVTVQPVNGTQAGNVTSPNTVQSSTATTAQSLNNNGNNAVSNGGNQVAQTNKNDNAVNTTTGQNDTQNLRLAAQGDHDKVLKRRKRDVGANPAAPNNAAPAAPNNAASPAPNAVAPTAPAAPVPPKVQQQDPNENNTGQGSINTVLTFDDPSIVTDKDRNNPTVTIKDNVDGYTLVDHGKVGFVNSNLRRSDMFDKHSPQNYQASGNVLVLGRVKADNNNDHGDFNGISKEVNVKPGSELVVDFTTMQTNSKQGSTNFVIKDAKNDTELAKVNVGTRGVSHLFKVPVDVDHLALQFLPDNAAVADATRITTNKDGYKYYSFIDNVGLHSGSHLYVKQRELNPTATNQKDYVINAEIGNNGNYGASLKDGQFVYSVTLPQGVSYVANSLSTSFPVGNNDSTKLLPMAEQYDKTTNTVTFTSKGVRTENNTHTKEVLFPEKSLKLTYKVNIDNVPTPQQIHFNDKLTYQTAADVLMNAANSPVVTLVTDPYTTDVVMNKEALQAQVDQAIDANQYTAGSIAEYNKLKEQATQVLNEEQNNVPLDQRKSQAAIDQLVQELKDKLVEKQPAITELDNKAQQMITTNSQNNQLTQEEIADITTKINNDKQAAINQIDQQTTAAGVTTAKDAGLNALAADVAVPTVKQAAKNAIIKAVAKRKQEIKKLTAPVQEEKDVANATIGNIEVNALTTLNSTNTNEAVETLKDNTINNINNVVPDSYVRTNAIDAINEAATNQQEVVNNSKESTDSEKAIAIAEIDKAKEAALKAIETPTTRQDVNNTKDAELAKIKAITAATTIKTNAKTAVEQAATQQIQSNNNATAQNATTDEITAANEEVEQAKQAALDAITEAQTDQEVETAKNNGIQAINSSTPDINAKQNAKTAVDEAYTTHKQEITDNQNATTEEKAAAITDLDNKKQQADTNIDQAQSNAEVETAKTNGINEINQVQPATQYKAAAKTAVEQAATQKNNDIDQDNAATTDEKDAAKAKVQQAVTEANEAIEQAAAQADVDNAKTTHIQNINNVQAEHQVKTNAKADIDQKVQEQQTAIQNNNAATTEEKAAAEQQLQAAKTAADNAIDAAQSNQDVDNVKAAEIAKITAIQPATTIKSTAKQAIQTKAEERKAQIAATADITAEERDAADQQVDAAVQQADTAIDNAASQTDVETAKTNGENAIAQVQPTVTKKNDARTALDNQANTKKQQIQGLADATTEEKTAGEALVDGEVTKGKAAIDQATTNAQVDTAQQSATDAINNLQPQVRKKRDALAEITQQQNSQTAEINNNADATTEEKEAALQQLQQAVTKANNDINAATTDADVDTAKTTGLADISAVQPATTTKTAAKNDLAQAATARQQTIEADNSATTEEKAAATELINQAKEQGDLAIQNAATAQEVSAAKDEAINNINGINADTTIKDYAKTEINNRVNRKRVEIQNDSNATTEEKATATQQLDGQQATIIQSITNANSVEEVNAAKDKGLQDLDNINAAHDIKTAAKDEIKQTLVNKADQISKTADITTEEANEAASRASQIYVDGINKINAANSTQEVNAAKDAINQEINAVQPTVTKKATAKNSLDTVANNKKADLDQTPNASAADIANAKQQVIDLLNGAKEKINQAQANADVDAIVADATNQIQAVKTLSTIKADAIADIENAYNQKVADIEAAINSTASEVNQAKQQLDNLKQQDIQKINQATTAEDVATQKDEGITNINGFEPQFTKKQTATDDLYHAADQKNDQILENDHATQEEKQQAANDVEAIVQDTLEKINNAADDSDVDEALSQGKAAIAAIQLATINKVDATKAIDTKADEIKAEINDNDALTDEEKASSLALVKQYSDDALAKINAATTDDAVDKAKQDGLVALDNIQVEDTHKQQAIDELESLLDQLEATANNNDNATTDEKEAYTNALEGILSTATDNINAQTTNAGVDKVKDEAKAEITKQNFDYHAKQNATNEVNKAIERQKEDIKNTPNVSEQSKQTALQDLARSGERFTKDLAKAKTDAEVTELQNATIHSIEAIIPFDETNNGTQPNNNTNPTPNDNGAVAPDNNGNAQPNNNDVASTNNTNTTTPDNNGTGQPNNSSVEQPTNTPTNKPTDTTEVKPTDKPDPNAATTPNNSGTEQPSNNETNKPDPKDPEKPGKGPKKPSKDPGKQGKGPKKPGEGPDKSGKDPGKQGKVDTGGNTGNGNGEPGKQGKADDNIGSGDNTTHKTTVTDKTETKDKVKREKKELPKTGVTYTDDLPYAELALGAGMAFLIRRFTKKDEQSEK